MAKIGSSARGASTLEGSGGMVPKEILKFSFSKIHIIFCVFSRDLTKK